MKLKVGQNFMVNFPMHYSRKYDTEIDFSAFPLDSKKYAEPELDTSTLHIGTFEDTRVAHAEGELLLTIKGIWKMPGYPTRIAFVKTYFNNDRHIMDYQINKLHITTIGTFNKLIKGWRPHYILKRID